MVLLFFRSCSLHFRANSSHLNKCLTHVQCVGGGKVCLSEQKGVNCITIMEASECPKRNVVSAEMSGKS